MRVSPSALIVCLWLVAQASAQVPRDPFTAGPGGPPASRERNFGPDAPPKGKRKPTYNRKDQQGPRGPIRTKTDNRIYSAFGDDDDPGVPGEFDDFATSLDPDTPDEE